MAKQSTISDGIRQLPSGKFQARYKAPDGSRRSLGSFDTPKAAQRALTLKEEEIEQHTWLDDRKAATPFYQFAWVVFAHKERALKRSTVINHKSILNRILIPAFGHLALQDIRPHAVETWHSGYRGGPVQRQHAYARLSNYLNHAVRWEYIRANPCQVPGGFSDPSAERPAWGVEDFRKALLAASPEFKPVLLTAFSGHLRAGEVMGLNIGDFDPETAILTVSRSLSNAEGLKETRGDQAGLPDGPGGRRTS